MSIFSLSQADKVYTRVSPEEMVSILADMGYCPQMEHTPEDFIKFKVEGITSVLLFYRLENGKAGNFQFRAGFNNKVPLEKVNLFNRKRRFGKAYLDSEGDIVLEMDVEVEAGVLRAEIEEVVKDWRICLGGFMQEMRAAA